MQTTHKLRARISRRIPDPNFKSEHGTEIFKFLVHCDSMPDSFTSDPNARSSDPSKMIYKDVEKSLLNEDCTPGTFHMKNLGLTLLAESVEQVGDDIYEIITHSDKQHGILNGSHTYEIIKKCNKEGKTPDNQFVFLDCMTNVPLDWVTELSQGLNTSMQVKKFSLLNLQTRFDFIKDNLKGTSFSDKIAWEENADGQYDVRDVLAIMYMLNPLFHSNDDPSSHPVSAYSSKESVLNTFSEKEEHFKSFMPLLKDALILYDTISFTARDKWNIGQRESGAKGAGRALDIIDAKKKTKSGKLRSKFSFPFIDKESDNKLNQSCLYPILASFRNLVVLDKNSKGAKQKLKWKVNDLAQVIKIWDQLSFHLLKSAYMTHTNLGRRFSSTGKDTQLWSNLHLMVKAHTK